MKKLLYNILIYLAIAFFIFYLFKIDYLIFDKLKFNYIYLSASLLLLWAGFIFSTFSWRKALKVHDIKIKRTDAILSHGISVFAKYIPGKIWVILGRASQISKKSQPLTITSIISLKEQLIYLLLGLLISLFALLISREIDVFLLLIFITIIGLVFILYSKKINAFIIFLYKKLLEKDLSIPLLNLKNSIRIGNNVFIYWALWILSFYLFLISILGHCNFHLAFSFPLAITYGLLAIIVPGGIGIREGIISGYLISNNIDPELAVTISIAARIWFITGEVFLFLVALVIKTIKIKSY